MVHHPDNLLQPISHNFHGREVFAPIDAHLAIGDPPREVGTAVSPAELVRVDLPRPQTDGKSARATVLYVDRYGNVQLAARVEDVVSAPTGVAIETAATTVTAVVGETFADAAPGELVLYEDSYGYLAVAANGGSAADVLGVGPRDELTVRLA